VSAKTLALLVTYFPGRHRADAPLLGGPRYTLWTANGVITKVEIFGARGECNADRRGVPHTPPPTSGDLRILSKSVDGIGKLGAGEGNQDESATEALDRSAPVMEVSELRRDLH